MQWTTRGLVLLVLIPALTASAFAAEGETDTPPPPADVLEDIRTLKSQLAHLDQHMPQGSGLARRIGHRRVERVWKQIADAAHQLASDLSRLNDGSDDRTAYAEDVVGLLQEVDSAIRTADRRIQTDLANLSPDESSLQPAELASIYHERNQLFARRIDLLQAQLQNVTWMAEYGMAAQTVAGVRDWLATTSTDTAEVASLSLEVATDDVDRLNAQIRRLPDNAELRSLRAVVEARIESLAANLHNVVNVMEGQSLPVTAYRQQIVLSTHHDFRRPVRRRVAQPPDQQRRGLRSALADVYRTAAAGESAGDGADRACELVACPAGRPPGAARHGIAAHQRIPTAARPGGALLTPAGDDLRHSGGVVPGGGIRRAIAGGPGSGRFRHRLRHAGQPVQLRLRRADPHGRGDCAPEGAA